MNKSEIEEMCYTAEQNNAISTDKVIAMLCEAYNIKPQKWYVVYDFGYSDTDSQIIEFDYELTPRDAADILGMEEKKIRLIERHD